MLSQYQLRSAIQGYKNTKDINSVNGTT